MAYTVHPSPRSSTLETVVSFDFADFNQVKNAGSTACTRNDDNNDDDEDDDDDDDVAADDDDNNDDDDDLGVGLVQWPGSCLLVLPPFVQSLVIRSQHSF
eukprot:5953988-Amphidinium_carterae.1